MSDKEKEKQRFLNQRSDKFTIVFNDSGANLFKSVRFIKQKLMTSAKDIIYLAVIKHDKDYDYDLQQLKTIHYHLIIQFSGNYRIGTIINYLIDEFHCNENQITIDKCTSLIMQTRYLVHLDDFDKFQYKITDIETNNFDFVNKAMKYIKNVNTIDDLIIICKEYTNLYDLMCVLGYENYKKYRLIITDIRKEMSNRL